MTKDDKQSKQTSRELKSVLLKQLDESKHLIQELSEEDLEAVSGGSKGEAMEQTVKLSFGLVSVGIISGTVALSLHMSDN